MIPLAAEARRFTPGTAFTATLKSDRTGATATMTWQTRRRCDQLVNVFSFHCLGRWECEGAACPGRRGRLQFRFDSAGYHQAYVLVSDWSSCVSMQEGVESEPRQLPFRWRYRCFTDDVETDTGTAEVALKLTP
jgi:hypothetical protein